jgi:DNA primase
VVTLRKRGREFAGLCPFHNESTPSFTVNEDKGFYHCFGCGAHGDVIRFKRDHDGLSFIDALQALEQDAGLQAASAQARRETVKSPRRDDLVDSMQAAAAVWGEAQRARGSLAENWMRARGINPDATGALDVIRFHPDCPAQLWRRWEKPIDARRRAPALVAPILAIRGGPGARTLHLRGVHLTFLSADGRAKAPFQPWRDRRSGEWVKPAQRLMWGNSAGGAVIIPRRPLDARGHELVLALHNMIDDQAAGPIVVAEGLESTISLMRRRPDARMGFATLSLRNLQGVEAKNGPRRSLQMWHPTADPDVRPFTFEQPGRVIVGVDADMKPMKEQWIQDRRGALATKRALTGLERAELCGALAQWHWARTQATRVDVLRPPAGQDFNDMDQRRMA